MSLGVSWDGNALRSARNEALLDTYRHQPRVELCACGATLRALPGHEAAVHRSHIATPRHRRWFAESGWE